LQKTINRCHVAANDGLRTALARANGENERLRRELCRLAAVSMMLSKGESMLLVEHYDPDDDGWTATAIHDWLTAQHKESR
jgi:hypothetical protein